MTTLLPQIGNGSLVADRRNETTGSTQRSKQNENQSLLYVSESLPPVYKENEQTKRNLRSKSHDRGELYDADDTKHVKKRIKIRSDNRSKSFGPSGRKRDTNRSKPEPDINENYSKIYTTDPNNNFKSPPHSASDRRVWFSNSSEETLEQQNAVQRQHHGHRTSGNGSQKHTDVAEGPTPFSFKASQPKVKIMPRKQNENKILKHVNQNVINSSFQDSLRSYDTRPADSVKKDGLAGSHQDRLKIKAARERATVWTETNSDPGPTQRSIDHTSVIKGNPSDSKRGRIPNDVARTKHAQFLKQMRREGRPKAAEHGRRLQSLPSKKETHANDVVERPVASAPAKDQKQAEEPMPKFNSLMVRDKQSETQKKVPPDKITKVKLEEPNRNTKSMVEKPDEHTKIRMEKQVPGAAGTSTLSDDKKRSIKFTSPTMSTTKKEPVKTKVDTPTRLPSDDHGPAVASPDTKPEPTPVREASPKKDALSYYATPRPKPGDERTVVPPLRLHSEKSYKTDATDKTKSSGDYGYASSSSQTKSEQLERRERSRSPSKSPRKRREVTIVDPKTLQNPNDSYENTFPEEYQTHVTYERRKKDFSEMDDQEKVDYFRDELHMRPDQIRELTFHPKTNVPRVIYRTYARSDTVNWNAQGHVREKSGRRQKSKKVIVYRNVKTIVPHQRKSFMLSRLQGVVYRHINKVYGASPRPVREKQFFQKLAQVQIDEYQRRYEMLAEKERMRLETKFRQREQLKVLRKKFEDDAWRRFMTQYVTSKVVEAEYMDREEYGLPNDLDDSHDGFQSSMRRKYLTLTPKRQSKANHRKYSNLFNYNIGPELKTDDKTMKFEGFDSVYVDDEDEHGNPTTRRQDVNALMDEAKRLLDQSDSDDMEVEDNETPRARKHVHNGVRKERPRPNKSRERKTTESTESKTTPRSKGSKSIHRPPPKTMKELIDRRKSKAVPKNRYAVSEFKAIKKDLVKDSVKLNEREKSTKSQTKLPNSDKTDEKLQSPYTIHQHVSTTGKVPSPEANIDPAKNNTPSTITQASRRTPSPEKSVNVSKSIKQEESTTTNDDGRTSWSVKDGNVYLDNAETQMAIETARDKEENEILPSPSPTIQKSQKTTTTTTTETTTTITENDPIKQSNRAADSISPKRRESRASLHVKQEQIVRKDPSTSRTPSRISNQNEPKKSTDYNNASYRQRRASKASLLISNNTNESTDTLNGKRRLSKTSMQITPEMSSKNENTNTNTHSSRLSVRSTEQRTTSINASERVTASNLSVRTDKDRKVNTPPENNATKSNEKSTDEQSNEKQPKANDEQKQQNIPKYESPPNIQRKSPSPSITKPAIANGYSENKTNIEGDGSGQKKTVNKTVHIADIVVTENTYIHGNINRGHRPSKVHKNDERSQLEKKSTSHQKENVRPKERQRTNEKIKPNKRISRSRSRTPTRDHSKMNGHDHLPDTRVTREEYEHRGHNSNKVSRRPSDSLGRKGSVTRPRKRSSSSERRHGRSKDGRQSRFPEIERVKHAQGENGNTRISRSERVAEQEYVTERVVTPKAAGQKEWKDLVQKYLRQPSPKVGKSEDRSILETNLETDDDDEDMDIFARAKKRYALNTDDEDSD